MSIYKKAKQLIFDKYKDKYTDSEILNGLIDSFLFNDYLHMKSLTGLELHQWSVLYFNESKDDALNILYESTWVQYLTHLQHYINTIPEYFDDLLNGKELNKHDLTEDTLVMNELSDISNKHGLRIVKILEMFNKLDNSKTDFDYDDILDNTLKQKFN